MKNDILFVENWKLRNFNANIHINIFDEKWFIKWKWKWKCIMSEAKTFAILNDENA